MDPVAAFNLLAMAVQTLADRADAAKTNPARLKSLAGRFSLLLPKIKAGAMAGENPDIIDHILGLVTEISDFISRETSKDYYRRLFSANSTTDAIDDFEKRLNDMREDLTFAFGDVLSKPSPVDHAKALAADSARLMEAINSSSFIIEEQIKEAGLEKYQLLAKLNKRFTESTASTATLSAEMESRASSGHDSTVTAGGGLKDLSPDAYMPSLDKITSEPYKSLKIGSGGFGDVYKVKSRGVVMAVKVSKANVGIKAERQIRAELSSMQRLGPHKNVLGVFGIYKGPDYICLVMEFGASLLHAPARTRGR